MPPDDRRDCTTEILGRGLALGPARLDQRLQVHPCSVRQHRPLLIPGGAKRPPPQSVQARTGPNAIDENMVHELARKGLVVTDSPDDSLIELRRRDELLSSSEWNIYSALYHFMTKWRDVDVRAARMTLPGQPDQWPEVVTPSHDLLRAF